MAAVAAAEAPEELKNNAKERETTGYSSVAALHTSETTCGTISGTIRNNSSSWPDVGD